MRRGQPRLRREHRHELGRPADVAETRDADAGDRPQAAGAGNRGGKLVARDAAHPRLDDRRVELLHVHGGHPTGTLPARATVAPARATRARPKMASADIATSATTE